jgi:hypothetical protein
LGNFENDSPLVEASLPVHLPPKLLAATGIQTDAWTAFTVIANGMTKYD